MRLIANRDCEKNPGLGIHCRITWKSVDGEFKSVNLFLELIGCDPAKNDKGAKCTAERLLNLIGRMNLEEFQSHFTFTSDHAIYQKMIEEMRKLGSDLNT